MSHKQSIEKIKLTNGETLEIHDLSRMISTDAWLLKAVFKIEIDLKEKDFNKLEGISDKKIKDKLGNTLVYEVIRERNFIKNPNRDKVFGEMKDSFLSINLKYLSHPDFAVKYALKIYNDKNRF